MVSESYSITLDWKTTHKTTTSGNVLPFPFPTPCADRAAFKCAAQTATLMRFFAQLKVRMKRSIVEGVIFRNRVERVAGTAC